MKIKQMIETLIDKGNRRDWAERTALQDYTDFQLDEALPDGTGTEECSICRRTFTQLQMKYHYHPCE